MQLSPLNSRCRLLELRSLIFETAHEIAEVGQLVETLKWGQPSYLPARPRVGSTVRLGSGKAPDRVALFFHCQSRLVEQFRDIYPDQFFYDGNRAIILSVADPVPVDALKHCISLCLTYHLNKKARG